MIELMKKISKAMVREATLTIWQRIEIEQIEFVRRQIAKHYDAIYAGLVERDGEKCASCESIYHLTIDHILQVANGGTNRFDNLRLLCSDCNSQEQGRYKEGRICAICGQQALLTFNHTWLCQQHGYEYVEIRKDASLSAKESFKLLRNKYNV